MAKLKNNKLKRVLFVMKFEAITSIIVDIVYVVGIIICRYRLEAW